MSRKLKSHYHCWTVKAFFLCVTLLTSIQSSLYLLKFHMQIVYESNSSTSYTYENWSLSNLLPFSTSETKPLSTLLTDDFRFQCQMSHSMLTDTSWFFSLLGIIYRHPSVEDEDVMLCYFWPMHTLFLTTLI